MRISDWSSDVCSSDLLDAISQLRRIGDVERGDMTDALDMHIREIDRSAECDARQDRPFVRRVATVGFETRIGLGITHDLRMTGRASRRESVDTYGST